MGTKAKRPIRVLRLPQGWGMHFRQDSILLAAPDESGVLRTLADFGTIAEWELCAPNTIPDSAAEVAEWVASEGVPEWFADRDVLPSADFFGPDVRSPLVPSTDEIEATNVRTTRLNWVPDGRKRMRRFRFFLGVE